MLLAAYRSEERVCMDCQQPFTATASAKVQKRCKACQKVHAAKLIRRANEKLQRKRQAQRRGQILHG